MYILEHCELELKIICQVSKCPVLCWVCVTTVARVNRGNSGLAASHVRTPTDACSQGKRHSQQQSNAETMWELCHGREERTSSQLQGHAHPCRCRTHRAWGDPLPLLATLKSDWKSLAARFSEASCAVVETQISRRQWPWERFPSLLLILLVQREKRKSWKREWIDDHAGANGRRRAAGGQGWQWQMQGLVSAGLVRAGRHRVGEQRGERGDPVPGCILPSPASLQPERQRWVINTSPGHSHHSGFITLFSALIPLLSADTALYWGPQLKWESSYCCFHSDKYTGNNTTGVFTCNTSRF